ncbi:MAG: cadmium-translocating P-type ATPase [Planctomycetota bacterium]|jgi:Cd2+/Zn2+-exporting ATPase|nr:cadmium-translocating P-type ATPase [Planctomycetota bacterium]
MAPDRCCPSSAASACCRPSAGPAGPDRPSQDFPWLSRLILPGSLLGLAWGLEFRIDPGAVPIPHYAVLLSAYLLCGWPVLKEAARVLGRGNFFNEFTLMSLATLVAIILGDLPEAVGVMLFYTVGDLVQEKAAGNSRRSLHSLLASKPSRAGLIRDGRIESVPIEMVPVGSLVLVKPGEMIPLDGTVTAGSARVDVSSLTGESLPESVEPGGRVYGGCLCLDGDLTVRTAAGPSESMLGRIIAMVEGAAASKSQSERFITVFARCYTPIITAAALLTAVLPPLLAGGEWEVWIYRALILLLCSCPCALFLSVPLAFFAGIGAASRQGMLVKGAPVLDALAKAKDVVFDKTGTLTAGKLSLLGAEPAPGVAREKLLHLAAIAESRSNHPLARAVLAEIPEPPPHDPEVAVSDLAGKGLVARTPRGEILIGNARLLRENGVDFPETGAEAVSVYLALDKAYQGRLDFADRLKPEAAAALRNLRESCGVRNLYMLTGDREKSALAASRELGLDGFRSGLLPNEKVAAFRELSPGGEAVFVGDGINDAPVIAASGVGVAMGALGSAAAVEAADAVILDDSLSRLPLLFRIAAKTRRVAGQNIVAALAIKLAVMGLGIAGLSGLWEAVFADVGVSLLAVLNSYRAARAS